ncbi:MAG: 3-oxoacyl-[acyl-carrier protein] reductase, partial [uncultured Solirubrobacteraceae bacterium]
GRVLCPRDRRLARHRRGDRHGAGRRRLERRDQLPRRRGGSPPHARGRRAGRRLRRARAGRRLRWRRASVRDRRGGLRAGRLPGQQRRRHRRRADHLALRRGLAARHRHQPDRRLPPDPPGGQGHGPAAQRARHQHRLGGGPRRQRRPGQLRGRQGGADRLHQDGRRRGGATRGDRQRGGARLHRDRHDQGRRRARRRAHPGASRRPARGGGRRRALPRLGRRRLRDRHDPVRRRRDVRL